MMHPDTGDPDTGDPDTGDPDTGDTVGLTLTSWTELDCTVGALRGELGTASAPRLREQLLGLLDPAASRIVIDLSAVSHADASGLAVLVGTGRRAVMLGGFLRLAAPGPAVADALRTTGLDQQLDIFPTAQAAIAGPAQGRHRTPSASFAASWSADPDAPPE